MLHRIKRLLRHLWTALRLLALFFLIAWLFSGEGLPEDSPRGRIYALTRHQSFDYIEWEIEALWAKAQQTLFGYGAYIPEDAQRAYLLDYFATQNQLWTLQGQRDQILQSGAAPDDELNANIRALEADLAESRLLAEEIIETQVSAVLAEEGFALLGQVLPPVSMHFLQVPDVLIVSPRDEIRQNFTLTLQAMTFEERVALEETIARAVPERAVYITRIGGVGVWPAMIRETDRAVVAFEVTAHEWLHHYLVFYPLGINYFTHPDTRIINETTATLFGNEIGNRVIERFYPQALARGEVYLQPIPDYRALLAAAEGRQRTVAAVDGAYTSPLTRAYEAQRVQTRALADFLLHSGYAAAAQTVLDAQQTNAARRNLAPLSYPDGAPMPRTREDWIGHTRLMADYLLGLGRVEAAEQAMAIGARHSGLRKLNQAWFAFNVGYQANPTVETAPDGSTVIVTEGGGGDPLGAAIYEIRARAPSLHAFIALMRGITTRAEVFAARERLRTEAETAD
ncbi:MAG: hypothetical protein ACLFTK_02270 [Anaerolineales bacterium]